MDGLLIKPIWLNRYYSGEKTLEVRSSNTKKRGTIALIECKSGLITGVCNLVDSYRLKQDRFLKEHHLHLVDKTWYKKTYGWVFEDVTKLDKPIPYYHPPGAVIWVKDVL